MLEILDDDVVIFGMLEEQDLLPKQFATDQLICWYDTADYYVTLFCAEGDDRGFVTFVVRDFTSALADLQLLRDFFRNEQRLYDSAMLRTAYFHVATLYDVVAAFASSAEEDSVA